MVSKMTPRVFRRSQKHNSMSMILGLFEAGKVFMIHTINPTALLTRRN